jgi:hypothetical protein
MFPYTEDEQVGRWNAGQPWSESELNDLRYAASQEQIIDDVTEFLMRPRAEVQAKAAELGIVVKAGND